jgi:hypothetical protein
LLIEVEVGLGDDLLQLGLVLVLHVLTRIEV